jgi:hypothetical protein
VAESGDEVARLGEGVDRHHLRQPVISARMASKPD